MAHSQDSCIDWPISLSEPFHPCHDAQSFIYFIPGYRSTKQLDVSCGQGGFVDYLWGWPALVFEINQHGGTPQQCKENCCTPKGPLSKKQTTHCWTIQGNNSHNHMSCPYIYIYLQIAIIIDYNAIHSLRKPGCFEGFKSQRHAPRSL